MTEGFDVQPGGDDEARADGGSTGRSGRRGRSRSDVQGKAGADGHTAPKVQPATAPSPAAPAGEVALGSVHFAKGVKADGKALAAGTYQVRLTAQAANPPAKGQSDGLERWVEFTQGGQVKGREVVTIIPQSEIAQVQKDTPPGSQRLESRAPQGRRLPSRLDPQGQQSLPAAPADGVERSTEG